MANNPINTNSFQHFLIIRGVEIEIQEPNNFFQSNFKIVQDDIARDTYFGNEESSLEFEASFGSPTGTFINNDGLLISHLPSGAELLIQENKDFGNEADVKYKLKKSSVDFTIGNIDFSNNFETDNESYVHCRVIQNNNQSLIKKREDITIDLLATKDLDDNTITAIPIQKIFLKAKPTYGESIFNCPNVYDEKLTAEGIDNPTGNTSTFFYFYNNCQVVIKDKIENTLSFLEQTTSHNGNIGANWEDRFDEADGFGLLQAKEDLTNIKINIKDFFLSQTADTDNEGNGFAETYFILRWGQDINNFTGTNNILYNFIYENGNTTQNITNFNFEIPFLQSSHKIWLFLRTKVRQSRNIPGNPRFECFSNISKYTVNITATSTGISSVGFAVRQIDLIKQTYKSIGSLPVNAEKYDVGGEFYDNFCYNKNLIRQDLSKPFYTKLKDVKEDLLEQCAYAQVNEDEIYIGKYPDFYRNIDMGGFIEIPTYESKIIKNPKYLVKKFVFGYEKYEQDRNERNTVDAIHTDSEFFVQANNSTNTKTIKLPFIRDSFLKEVARKLVFSIQENSTSDDDNIFKDDVIPLAPNSRSGFFRKLTFSEKSNPNELSFLSDGTFSWNLLGFKVGDTILYQNSPRVVIELTSNIIKITGTGFDESGTVFAKFDYPLTDVVYTNRTSEGLIFSENLRNSDKFGNLRYSIKRNLKHWYSVLATYGKFIPTKKIKNTYFKANGECTTQFVGEIEPIKENEDILISDITDFKILSQDLYITSVKCEFEQAVQLLKDIQKVRGFIRVQTPTGAVVKGYIKEGNFVWADGILELELEVKNESDFLTIVFSNGIFSINEVGYDTKTTTEKKYNIFNDFIQFFDENNINLCNRTRFDKVSLNGIIYTNIDDLVNALEPL